MLEPSWMSRILGFLRMYAGPASGAGQRYLRKERKLWKIFTARGSRPIHHHDGESIALATMPFHSLVQPFQIVVAFIQRQVMVCCSALLGGAWLVAACWLANPAEAASSSGKSNKSSKSKKKASSGGGTGPSLTKNQEKTLECATCSLVSRFTVMRHAASDEDSWTCRACRKNEREVEFQERMAKIRAGGAPSF